MVSNSPMSPRIALALILVVHAAGFSAQELPLTITSASPQGEVAQIDDANEIRLTFSEPMVAVGQPETTVPDWIRIEPAVKLLASWSGTRTLLLTPDPDAPLTFGTTYRLQVAPSARSVAGRTLARAFDLSFTTPTARLLQADWYRADNKVSQPVFIRLRFNQEMDPAAVLRHLRVNLEPHAPQILVLTGEERTRWGREDAANLRRFDARVASVLAVARSQSEVPVVVAADWNRERFQDDSFTVVLRTVTPPSPGSWLRVRLDDGLTGRQGTVPHQEQSSVMHLEEPLFPVRPRCDSKCNPGLSWEASPMVTRGLHLEEWRARLKVADVVDGKEHVLQPAPMRRETYRSPEGHPAIVVETLGYPPHPPASTRVYDLSADTTSVDGQVLGFRSRLFVTTTHAFPYSLVEGQVWESKGRTSVPLLARNTRRVDQYLMTMQPGDILPRLLAVAQSRSTTQVFPPVAPQPRALTSQPDANESHALDLSSALGARGTGLVWAAVRPTEFVPDVGDTRLGGGSNAILQVTNLGLSVKDSPTGTLAWVTTLDGAAPVAGAKVSIRNKANEVVWSGTTGADGISLAPALSLRDPNRPWDLAYVVTAEKDGDLAWVASDWTSDAARGVSYSYTGTRPFVRGSVFTDRGVYALGDEVRLKGILRHSGPAGIGPVPAGAPLDVVIVGAGGQEVSRERVAASEWSSVERQWRIPATSGLGYYQIRVVEPGQQYSGASGSFMVGAFRRPDFSVDVTLEAAAPVLGNPLKGSVNARFLFGAALGAQPVNWRIWKQPVHDIPAAMRERYPADRFAFGYQRRWDARPLWNDNVIDRQTTLPADGPLEVTQATVADVDHAVSFALQGHVQGVSGQYIANRTSHVLHPASMYIGIVRPPYLVDATKPLTVEVFAADLAGATRVKVPVTVTLLREEWRPERTEVALGTWPIVTTAGRVTLPVPLTDAGSYILRAVGKDEAGRVTRTEVTFYAYGRGRSYWHTEGNHVALVPERETWKPGEQARLLVQTPWPTATALVTMERDGVRRHERMTITAPRNTITLPITEDDIPNVFVSVLLLKGRTGEVGAPHEDPGKPGYRLGYAQLKVDHGGKRLNVEVAADRAEYQPRDKVQVSVHVSDVGDRPRRGEVTLWAMDEGLLALTNYTLPDIARAVYADRALQVQTVETRTRLIDRRAMSSGIGTGGTQGRGGGGGGAGFGIAGGVAGGMPAPPAPAAPPPMAMRMTVDTQAASVSMGESIEMGQAGDPVLRNDFRPLAFWVGSLVTGTDGRASATVTLPDSLTKYRIMAVAGDLASHFGVGDSSMRTSLPLTLLPALPRFLAVGNRASFGATVTNNSTTGGTVRVDVSGIGGTPLVFEGETTQTITLAAGESAPVRFDARARTAGEARVRITARLGASADAFEMTFPIIAPAPIVTTAAYADTTRQLIESIAIPRDVAAAVGGLTVTLTSTALAGLGDVARSLDDYPYDCAEPLASRALAQLLAADLQGAFGTPGISRETLRERASATLTSLSRFRCGDGGYGPFASNCQSSPYLTAYIVYVLRTADALQIPIDRRARDEALSYLERNMRNTRPQAVQWWPAWAATQAFMVKVLTESGRPQVEAITELYAAVDRLPIFALSYLADALHASPNPGPRYTDVVRRLSNRVRVEADRAFVEELDEAALVWLWHSNVRATGVVLEGLVRRGDQSDLVPALARWLAAERTSGRWATTQEQAVALHAMVAYYRVMEPEAAQMTVATRLGDTLLATKNFEGRSTVAQQVVVPMTDLVPGATSALSVERTGIGRVYANIRLQYQPTGVPDPVTRGIRLTRQYSRAATGAATDGPPVTEFNRGDVVRVTISVWIPHEGRFMAITDPLPAGLEAVDGTLNTTARELAREATRQSSDESWLEWWRRGGFQHVDKHDDRVVAYATRLAAGRHEFSYLARAMTAGTFETAGTWGEAMYAPEISGRAPAATIVVR